MAHEIIINRMFTGAYLEDERNIGHEIINLYKPDEGERHYIYLVPSGDYSAGHESTEIDGILLVRGINANCLEVLARAIGIRRVFNNEPGRPRKWTMLSKGEEFWDLAIGKKKDGQPLSPSLQKKRENLLEENAYQRAFIKENNICYGNIPVHQLFENNPEAKYNVSLFITFEADIIQKAKMPFYLVTEDKEKIPGKINFIIHRDRLSGSAGATFYPDTECENYTTLKQILFDSGELWGEDVKKFDPDMIHDDETFSYFTIARKEYDELAYSNTFAYFFEKYSILMEIIGRIAKNKYGMDIQLQAGSASKHIYREKENIDILITDDQTKNTIVIENKIKSGINGERHDLNGDYVKNQLDNYHAYVEKTYPCENGYRNHYFIFMPDYNTIKPDSFQTEAQKAFKTIYYSELYQGFTACQASNPALFEGDYYWQDFLRAIKKHSVKYDNNFEEVMKRKMKKLVDEAALNSRISM
jgi:hypothetical protein